MMINIRQAIESDSGTILHLIHEIADYEKLSHEVENTEELIRSHFFCDNPKVFALLIEQNSVPIGYAIYFYSYSTFVGRHGLYLEDFYIQENFRRQGIGKQIFQYLIDLANQEQLGRMEWVVLKWNELAKSFYNQYNAKVMDEWDLMRLSEHQLKTLHTKQ